MENTDQKGAMRFWNSLSDDLKKDYLHYMQKYGAFDATLESVSANQIEQIWMYAV
jgi:hypothetical protein